MPAAACRGKAAATEEGEAALEHAVVRPQLAPCGMVEAPSQLCGHEALRTRFAALDRWLWAHRALWRPRPFSQLPVPWEGEHPQLVRWLSDLDEGAIDGFEGGRDAELPPVMRRWAEEAAAIAAVPSMPVDGALSRRLRGQASLRHAIKGRKWEQVASFSAALGELEAERVVDWCGGKGHLGRTLGALAGRPVTVVELDGRLEQPALALARRAGVDLRFVEADALMKGTGQHLERGALVVALHACGGLTNALIEGLDGRPAELALAPCCFHLQHRGGRGCVPLSSQARGAQLPLDHATLRLATVEEVVASPKLRAARRRERAWRLGLDLLVRQARGLDAYTPLGNLPAPVIALPFSDFCQAVAASQRLELPPAWSAPEAQKAGEERARQSRALSLVRGLFRRPIELWLVLDRALALAEQGYEVQLGTFCARRMTPRNLLIRGRRPG